MSGEIGKLLGAFGVVMFSALLALFAFFGVISWKEDRSIEDMYKRMDERASEQRRKSEEADERLERVLEELRRIRERY